MVLDLKKADIAFDANGIQIYNRSAAGRFRKEQIKTYLWQVLIIPGSIEPDELFSHVM